MPASAGYFVERCGRAWQTARHHAWTVVRGNLEARLAQRQQRSYTAGFRHISHTTGTHVDAKVRRRVHFSRESASKSDDITRSSRPFVCIIMPRCLGSYCQRVLRLTPRARQSGNIAGTGAFIRCLWRLTASPRHGDGKRRPIGESVSAIDFFESQLPTVEEFKGAAAGGVYRPNAFWTMFRITLFSCVSTTAAIGPLPGSSFRSSSSVSGLAHLQGGVLNERLLLDRQSTKIGF